MDWRASRNEALARARRVVIKVGSAVLTGPDGLDESVIASLAAQIAALHDRGMDVVLVTSGAVSAGRRVMRGRMDGLPERQAASAIGQSRLMHAYDQAFAAHGKVTAQLLLTREGLMIRSRFLNILHTFRTLLSWRVIPVVNENDVVAVEELEFGDNDTLASLLLNIMEADVFVNLTSARGVFDRNPAQHADARSLDCIPDIAALDVEGMCSGKTAEGTGGMYSKLLAARRAAQLGVPTLIVHGREPQALVRAFDGQAVGTWVAAEGKAISRRKFWLAYNSRPEGVVEVDQGAAGALVNRGKSLLPAGIRAVQGEFGAGALVRIADAHGQTLGVGLSNYSAEDLGRIMGHKSGEIGVLLGREAAYDEAVHRDNMLLDAAL